MNKIVACFFFIAISFSLSSCYLVKSLKRHKHKVTDSVAIVDSSSLGKGIISPAITTLDTLLKKDTAVVINNDKAKEDSLVMWKQNMDAVMPLWKHRMAYNTFSGKAKVHYEGGDDSYDFNANFRIRKDSVIWIEINAMAGIFRVRIFVTPDSLYMINYMKKEVTILPLSDAAKILPSKIDFSSLQNLITGEPLRDGNIVDVNSKPDSLVIDVSDSAYLQQFTYTRADSNMVAAVLATRKPDGPVARSAYSNYERIKNRKISMARVINLQNGADAFKMEMEFIKADFDEPLDYPLNIPKNYTRR